MADWSVVHKEHDGSVIATVDPENLTFTFNKGEIGPHEINYELSRSSPHMSHDLVGPYRTDFVLKRGPHELMAGMHTMLGGSSEDENCKIAGKDWLHWLEKQHYPFNPGNPNQYRRSYPTTDLDHPPTGLAYQAYQQDVMHVIGDILDLVVSMPYALDLTHSLGTSTHLVNYRIDLADTNTIYSMIQTFAQEEPGGFDFWVTVGKVLTASFPRQYDRDLVSADKTYAVHVFDSEEPTSGMFTVGYTNTGPEMTHILGLGSGLEHRLGYALGEPASEVVYRRLMESKDFGDVPNQARIERLTRGAFKFGLEPIHEITLTCVPDTIPNFWTTFKPGLPIWVTAELEFHKVDSAQEIVHMSGTVDNEGNELCEFGLNQIYPTGGPGVVGG